MSSVDQKSDGVSKNRRKSRELALQTLYACEVGTTNDWHEVLDQITETHACSSETKLYALELVKQVNDHMEDIDSMIKERAANWDLKRMAAIDRNIIRLSVAELRFFPFVPVKVVIDEAVELAKIFGTDDSGKFVNGIIDSIYKKMKSYSGNPGKEGFQDGTNP
jgi:N utilization substance protein B